MICMHIHIYVHKYMYIYIPGDVAITTDIPDAEEADEDVTIKVNFTKSQYCTHVTERI